MKCPDCFSDNYSITDTDPVIMSCDDCHCFHSVSWSTGFWIGYIQKEQESNTDKKSFCVPNIREAIRIFKNFRG